MEVKAQLNYLRISPRKVRAVTQLLKGLDVDMAQVQLKHIVRRPAKALTKLLNSAIANAQHNFGLDKNYLYIKDIIVNEGIKLKRYKPKALGMAMPIQKKTSNIKIVLDELSQERRKKKEVTLAKKPQLEEARPKEELKEFKEVKKSKPKFEKKIKKEAKRGVFREIKTLGQKLFRRKSI